VRRPGHALQLALVYIEGTIFSASLFVMPLLNPWLFLFGITLYLCILSGLGLFAMIKRRRFDLLLAVPLRLALTYVHAWILLEQCVKEFFFKDRTLVWFQPTRREVQRI
jgi:hypothetical protein